MNAAARGRTRLSLAGMRILIERHRARPRYMTPMSEADRQQNLDAFLDSLGDDA